VLIYLNFSAVDSILLLFILTLNLDHKRLALAPPSAQYPTTKTNASQQSCSLQNSCKIAYTSSPVLGLTYCISGSLIRTISCSVFCFHFLYPVVNSWPWLLSVLCSASNQFSVVPSPPNHTVCPECFPNITRAPSFALFFDSNALPLHPSHS